MIRWWTNLHFSPRWIGGLILLLLVVIVLIEPELELPSDPLRARALATFARHDSPDWIVINAKSHETNLNGQLKNRLLARKLTHIALKNVTEMEQPHFIVYSQHKKPLHITAKKGLAYPNKTQRGIKRLDLWQQVRIQQAANHQSPGSLLKTTAISYYPKTGIVQTQAPVVYRQGNTIISSVGMKSYLDRDTTHLLGHVRGRHEAKTER